MKEYRDPAKRAVVYQYNMAKRSMMPVFGLPPPEWGFDYHQAAVVPVDPSLPVEQNLEIVFAKTQGDTAGDVHWTRDGDRSTSVGDVILLCNKDWYRVESDGWSKLDQADGQWKEFYADSLARPEDLKLEMDGVLLATFTAAVVQFDWSYEFSDDGDARIRGGKQLSEIIEMKNALGPAYSKVCRDIWTYGREHVIRPSRLWGPCDERPCGIPVPAEYISHNRENR